MRCLILDHMLCIFVLMVFIDDSVISIYLPVYFTVSLSASSYVMCIFFQNLGFDFIRKRSDPGLLSVCFCSSLNMRSTIFKHFQTSMFWVY